MEGTERPDLRVDTRCLGPHDEVQAVGEYRLHVIEQLNRMFSHPYTHK